MSKKLTHEFIALRTKCDRLEKIKNLNLWGNDIEDVSILIKMPSLEVVSLSVNKIKTLRDFAPLKKLKELYLRKNYISELSDIKYLVSCTYLKVLWLSENPVAEHKNYRKYVIKSLPQLEKLDDNLITAEERIADVENGQNSLDFSGDQKISRNNSFVKTNEENVYESDNYHVTKIIDSEDENDYICENPINEEKSLASFSIQNEIYSNNEKKKKIKDKFKSNLSHNRRKTSSELLDGKNMVKILSELKLDDEEEDTYFKLNDIRRMNTNNFNNFDRNTKKPVTQVPTRQSLINDENIFNNVHQIKKDQSYQNSLKSTNTGTRSHNILSSILLLIQELNQNDMEKVRSEIQRRLY